MQGTDHDALIAGAAADLADGLVLVDREGRVAYLNRRASDFLELNAADWLGQSETEFYRVLASRSGTPDSSRAEFERAAAAAHVMPLVEFRLAGNPPRAVQAQWFEWHDTGGALTGYGLVLRDVTREKELDEMKNQLLSIVSHELRTPLAAIKGFAGTLLREDVRWDDATQRDFLKIIDEETDRLSELIDNLLDMSQIEAGALRVAKEPVQLRNLVRDAKERAARHSDAHWFVIDLPSPLPRAFADPRRVRQVLSNLLENAIKYSPGGGQITISCEVEGDRILISVSDQGQGIPPQYLERVFERFFQIEPAGTRKTGGSGLGLAIARGIVEAHGGKIWAESTPGQGSIFRFTLPLYHEPVPVEDGE